MFLDRIRAFLNKNGKSLTEFMVAVLLAFSIWLIYNLTLNYTKVVSVPVVAVSNIEGHKNTSSNVATVLARCHTRGFDLLRLENASEKKPIKVNIDPSDLHPDGGELFHISAAELNRYSKEIFGDKAGMETFVTESLSFRFPFENSKKVPVHPVVSISCLPQYMLVGGLKLTPDSVTVYGEPYHLENIDRVYTRPFRLMDLCSTAHGEVKLEGSKDVRLSDESVQYMVTVQRYVEIKGNMEIHARNVPKNKSLVIYPSVASVTFRCSFPVTVEPENDIHFFIDYKDFAASLGGKCLARCDSIPSGVIDYRMEPELFECVESDR